MNRREFLLSLPITIAGMHQMISKETADKTTKHGKENWVWSHFSPDFDKAVWKQHFERMKKAGIDNIIVDSYNGGSARYPSKLLPVDGESLLPFIELATSMDVNVHAWVRAMLCNVQPFKEKHPEWFTVNRNGVSTLEAPPYVGYYNWLCPSRSEVQHFMKNMVTELTTIDGLQGIHLDYIRYSDVILPDALQPKYGLVQDHEMPRFDFCYCEVCQAQFKEKHAVNPLEIEIPHQDWQRFREENIRNIVKICADAVRPSGKTISAAVFATPTLARKYVRQKWEDWDLDIVFPMIYHNFYAKDVDWIEAATREGVQMLNHRIPLYSGLFIPSLSPEELKRAIGKAKQGGAKGFSLFEIHALKAAHWEMLETLQEKG